ncbi:MAG: haloalkane dehalogenase [Alphaproteobacteria bacterium]|nr:haloalkane dehalogenase [Alphaproteobacteria bacterium]MBV9903536.1 haloalkane dehalogenase [Alphaproteobacteria bacterium]
MDILRTPDARFANLPGYDFAPHYTEIASGEGGKLRIHHIDEGPRGAAPVLLMHGEPSWSYLYRNIIPPLVAAGHRTVAPDLIGFGRSDKPASQNDYTYERHVKRMSDWLLANDLRDITLFCQDWGGLIGLRLVAAFPERFARVVVANTGMPVGFGSTPAFDAWLNFSQNVPVLPVGNIVQGGTVRELSAAEVAAYDAPYPDERYKAGARRFPALVPMTPGHASVEENKAAWQVLRTFEKPFLCAFSDSDPVSKGGDAAFLERVPGTKGQRHVTIEKAGHFLQEDKPAEIAALLDAFIRGTH